MISVVAHETVTSTGPTNIAGEVAVFPGAAIVGFPPGSAMGLHHGDAIAQAALRAATAEFKALMDAGYDHDLTGKDLGGMILVPGVYRFSSSAELTGVLTLNGPGRYVFLIGSTLTVASTAAVKTIGDCEVAWAVGSSATLGTASDFVGQIISQASITLTTGAQVAGNLAALAGAVTLDSARVG
jgi:hypothetical protein